MSGTAPLNYDDVIVACMPVWAGWRTVAPNVDVPMGCVVRRLDAVVTCGGEEIPVVAVCAPDGWHVAFTDRPAERTASALYAAVSWLRSNGHIP